MAPQSDNEHFKWIEIEASDLLYLLRKHVWLLILPPLFLGSAAVFTALQMTPVFVTETSLYLRPNFDKEMLLARTFSKLDDTDSLRSIELALVSDSVILGMVDTLDLRDDPDFLGSDGRFPTFTQWYRDHPSHFLVRSIEELMTWLGLKEKPPRSDYTLLKTIRDRYEAKLEPNTRTVHLSVEDYDPQRVAQVANALVAEFLEHFRNDRSQKEEELRESLIAQSEKALAEAMIFEAKLEEFRSDHSEVLVEQDSSVFHDRLLSGGNALSEAENERSRLAGIIRMLEDVDPEKDPYQVFQILANRNQEYLSKLLEMQANAKTNFAEASQKYTPRHPAYQVAESRLEEIEATMRSYAVEMKESIASEHAATIEKITELNDSLAQLRGDFVRLKSTSAEFRGIKEKMDRNWNTYTQLQQKILDLDLDPEVSPTFVTTVSDPVVPDRKAKPRILFFAAGGVFLGGLVAMSLLAFRYRGGLPFTALEQARKQLHVPSLGQLNVSTRGDRDLRVARLLDSPDLVGLLFWTRESKIIQVTAIENCPGADLVGRALALNYARHDSDTLLVSFRSGLNAPTRFGCPLMSKLTELVLPFEVLLNPPEFRSEIRRLAMDFDQVIIESTTLAQEEAKLAIANVAQRTLLVVTRGGASRRHYQDFIERSSFNSGRIIATVFVGKAGQKSAKALHGLGTVTPTLDPATQPMWPQPVQGEFDYGKSPGPRPPEEPLFAKDLNDEPVTPFTPFTPAPGKHSGGGPFG